MLSESRFLQHSLFHEDRKWFAIDVLQPKFPLKVRNCLFSEEDLEWIHSIIAENPMASRQSIPREVCLVLDWYQTNSELKMMGCKAAMLFSQRQGLIQRLSSRQIYILMVHPSAHLGGFYIFSGFSSLNIYENYLYGRDGISTFVL